MRYNFFGGEFEYAELTKSVPIHNAVPCLGFPFREPELFFRQYFGCIVSKFI